MPTEVLIADDLEPIRQILQQSAERSAENTEAISRLERIQAENAEQIASNAEQVARNAEGISRLELLTEQNSQAISRLEQIVERNSQSIGRLELVVEQNSRGIAEFRSAITSLTQFVERSLTEAANDRQLIRDVIEAIANR